MGNIVESFSGIRGVYGKGITEDVIKGYTSAFLRVLDKKNPRIIVGCDSRPSSQLLKKAAISVLPEVIDIGYSTTPMAELAVREYGADGGIMITASHNEPEFNGWKFLRKDGAVLSAESMKRVIKNYSQDKSFEKTKAKVEDKSEDIIKEYILFIKNILGDGINKIKEKRFKLVLDPNGSPVTLLLKPLFDVLGVDITIKNSRLGEFKRKIEPNKESLEYLGDIISDEAAEFGAGFDCDADRVELVLPSNSGIAKKRGYLVSGNYVLALVVDEILSETQGVVVINDVTSKVVEDIAARYDCRVKEVEVGEINVVDEMINQGSPVGGEGSSSGGIVPPSRCRDGILTICLILKLLARKDKNIQEVLEDYPEYYSVRLNVKCPSENAVEIRKKIKKHFEEKGMKTRTTGDETGGLKIIYPEGFIWFRGSKTELGVFRIISDAKTKERADELLEDGQRVFESFLY